MIDLDRNATIVLIICGFVFCVVMGLLCTKAQEAERAANIDRDRRIAEFIADPAGCFHWAQHDQADVALRREEVCRDLHNIRRSDGQ